MGIRPFYFIFVHTKEKCSYPKTKKRGYTLKKVYNMTEQDVLEQFSTKKEGLSEEAAKKVLEEVGPNELAAAKQISRLKKFLNQFKDFMILILIIAAVVSFFIGESLDAMIILAIVILNAVMGFVQEKKAEDALKALKKMSAPLASVRRDGHVHQIDTKDLVPGDIVLLAAGSVVPADIRLISANTLTIQESALTGESEAVTKQTEAIEGDAGIGDRLNMAFSSSIVTYGRGEGIVVSTGMNTEMGSIAALINSTPSTETPLKKRLESLGKILGIGAVVICAVLYLIGILYGKDPLEMLLTSISLAVAAIPEGLPAVSTIVLALGVQRMASRNAIIRSLPSVETLGRATIICSDKTGTLTQNKMTVTKFAAPGIISSANETDLYDKTLFECMILCNDTEITKDGLLGDPTETALTAIAQNVIDPKTIIYEYPRVYETPFDSERKRMATVNEIGEGVYRVYVKGAADELIKCCTQMIIDGHVSPLSEAVVKEMAEQNRQMANSALRVLAYAYKDVKIIPNSIESAESDLIYIGLTGMIDPPRQEAKEAVAMCIDAGIKPVMITGDHINTAIAIARDLNILKEDSEAIMGSQLEAMSDEELKANIRRFSVYARVAPEHKSRIVKAMQERGEIVAMTGDGVNDAPALKKADIGAAMGITGTDVAKEAADMILADDNFATIVAAVAEGRRIFANILKTIKFLLSSNIGEILTLFIAIMIGWNSPLLPVHILFVNLVTDSLPALALGVDPAIKGIMKVKSKDMTNDIFTKPFVFDIVYQGVMIAVLTLSAFCIGNAISLETGRTMAFSVLIISQLVHSLNVRTNGSIFKTRLKNKYYLLALLGSIAITVVIMVVPIFETIFELADLTSIQWMYVLALSIAPIPIVELVKVFTRRIFK